MDLYAPDTCYTPLEKRLERYGKAFTHAKTIAFYLSTLDDARACARSASMLSCGHYLGFEVTEIASSLRYANFCRQHLICPLCAIRRASKYLSVYTEKIDSVLRTTDKLALITLTVKNGECLSERYTHLRTCYKQLMRRHQNSRLRSGWSSIASVSGGVTTFEVTNKGNGWHPHAHMLAICPDYLPCQKALSDEWQGLTDDSFIVDVRPITNGHDGFLEVFKYAVKFGDLSPSQVWHVHSVLKGQRLLQPFGSLYGVKLPDTLLDEPLTDSELRFFRFFAGRYQETGETLESFYLKPCAS